MGESMAIRALRKAIAKVAPIDAPVLITGETGTGKELVACSLHEASARSAGPFIPVNCAAVPEELFQAEVFGYEKGAFTGAYRSHAGHIEAARGGTLLLDEIGDLSLDTQVVLLRFLEEGVFERLGSTKQQQADVRVIAATNVDLETACRKGAFREDLFYRLNALRLHTPVLRERLEDIEPMARAFLDELIEELRLSPHQFHPDTLSFMRTYSWPGNVRELRNRIRQALVMSEGESLRPKDFGLQAKTAGACGGPIQTLREAREAAEREAIEKVLIATGGNVEVAAARLQISRAQLYRLASQYQLSPRAADRRRPHLGRPPPQVSSGEDRRTLQDRRDSDPPSRRRHES